MDIQPLRDAYWSIVTGCLQQFHGYSLSVACELSRELRDVIDSPRHQDAPPPGYERDLFFHGEPFYVACDIAGTELDLREHRAAYDTLVSQRYAVAEELLQRPGTYSARVFAKL